MSRLFAWILNLAYAALLLVASPWILWSAFKHGKYREGFAEKFLGRVPRREGERPRAWLHAVSVGEVNLLATIIGELSARLPEWEIVISTTTKTGYDLACRKYPSRTVFYCPLDFSWAVGAAMRRLRPTLLVLAELELWPNLVAAANRRGVPVAIINGRLSDKSFRGYCRLRWLVARTLRRIDVIAAQNQETAERFLRLGARPEAVHATGSLKFDGAQTDRANPRTAELRELAGLIGEEIVLLVGSTQAPEEEYALSIFKRLEADHPKLRLIIVPRHTERF
jgi:3-deoxy-D-manno-octulosonic-acid transferase